MLRIGLDLEGPDLDPGLGIQGCGLALAEPGSPGWLYIFWRLFSLKLVNKLKSFGINCMSYWFWIETINVD